MARFTVRVELRKEKETIPHQHPSYQLLHAEMENEDFSQTIIGTTGIEYKLPPAEYNKIGNYTREQVRDSAIRAAKKAVEGIYFTYSVLVTGPDGRAWIGLDRAD